MKNELKLFLCPEVHTYQILQLIEVTNIVVNDRQAVAFNVKCAKPFEMKQRRRECLQQIMTAKFTSSTISVL